MKHLIVIIIFSLPFGLIAQSNTEIFLFDIELNNSKIIVENGHNISNNEGFDNQPSFLSDEQILFASTRDGQTDIAQYHSNYQNKLFINSTEGEESSPLKIPNKDEVSAVRLDKDGKQRLYSYNLNDGTSIELGKDLVVKDYTWYNEELIIASVIDGDQLNLYKYNINTGEYNKLASHVGRSFHNIPNSDLVSFISKEHNKQWQIKSLNPKTGKIKLIANTITGVEDICWLNEKNLLSGKGSTLYKLTLQKDNNWRKVENLSGYEIVNISRLATNKIGNQLLITGEMEKEYKISKVLNNTESIIEDRASNIVQKHIEPFNNRNLDEFANTFNEDIKVNRFPAERIYTGRDSLKNYYQDFFDSNERSSVKVVSRIDLNNVVIDEEIVTIDNTTKRQVTIYEVDNNSIKSMTFINNSKRKRKAESVVNERLKYFNEKDIKAFGRTYAKNIEVYSFPNYSLTDNRTDLRDKHIPIFKNTPDLYAEVVSRIIIGNKIIDKERIIRNGKTFYNISIYEIENSLIKRVTIIE